MTDNLVPHAIYEFKPQADITAYELALIMMGTHDNRFGDEEELDKEFMIKEPRLVCGPILARGECLNRNPLVCRHFVPHVDRALDSMITNLAPPKIGLLQRLFG